MSCRDYILQAEELTISRQRGPTKTKTTCPVQLSEQAVHQQEQVQTGLCTSQTATIKRFARLSTSDRHQRCGDGRMVSAAITRVGLSVWWYAGVTQVHISRNSPPITYVLCLVSKDHQRRYTSQTSPITCSQNVSVGETSVFDFNGFGLAIRCQVLGCLLVRSAAMGKRAV